MVNANADVRALAHATPVGHGPNADGIATAPGRGAPPRDARTPVAQPANANANAHVRTPAPRDARTPVAQPDTGQGDAIAPSNDHARVRARVGRPSPVEREALAAGRGARIAELRKGKGLTQRELAAKARVSVGHVQALERGRSRPSAELLAVLTLILAPAERDAPRLLEELIVAGDVAVGGGRRRYGRAAREQLRALRAAPRVEARLALTLRRGRALADKLEAAGMTAKAAEMRAAMERLADGASADQPLTSADSAGAGSVRTPRRPGGAK